MTNNDIIKAFDILNKMEFFGGQRAGRELWFNKPRDIQDKDIGEFLRDIDYLKDFIKCQKTEIERLGKLNKRLSEFIEEVREATIKEFTTRANDKISYIPQHHFFAGNVLFVIDEVKKEMTEGEQ